MEKLKFILFSIIVLVILGLVGYWAFTTIQTGADFSKNQKIKQLQTENENLNKELKNLNDELGILKSKVEEPAPVVVDNTIPQTEKKPPSSISTYKYQSFIDDLQKLVDGNISMKLKSSGTRVGTLQDFLNIYNNTSNKIDNDYGVSTQKAIIAFQKAQGLKADGEAGVSTFKKMIDWLKKQN